MQSVDSFVDRCDATVGDVKAKTHMRKFFQDHYVTKGLGAIAPALAQPPGGRGGGGQYGAPAG